MDELDIGYSLLVHTPSKKKKNFFYSHNKNRFIFYFLQESYITPCIPIMPIYNWPVKNVCFLKLLLQKLKRGENVIQSQIARFDNTQSYIVNASERQWHKWWMRLTSLAKHFLSDFWIHSILRVQNVPSHS